jgi:hypothetical protein
MVLRELTGSAKKEGGVYVDDERKRVTCGDIVDADDARSTAK